MKNRIKKIYIHIKIFNLNLKNFLLTFRSHFLFTSIENVQKRFTTFPPSIKFLTIRANIHTKLIKTTLQQICTRYYYTRDQIPLPSWLKYFLTMGGPIISKSLIRIPLYIYIYTHISRPTDSFQRSIQPRRDSAWKFTLRSTADSVFSFGRADRRTARNSANLSAVDHRVSSKANTLPVASSMRVQACFSQITSMKRYNNLSLPRANHEFIFSRDPSNIWSVCRSMIFFFKDVAWWSVVNERGFTKNLVRKRGKVVREGYGRNMKTGWIVENWRDVVRAWSRFSNFFFFEIQFVLDPFEINLFKELICNYDTDILLFFLW